MAKTVVRFLAIAALIALGASSARAADWAPAQWTDVETLELLTTGPEEGPYWFKVWLVVLDNNVYVRLGTKAASRVEKNTTAPYVGVKIAGQEFPKVKLEPATPELTKRVSEAMGAKYWSDIFVHFMSHPMTMRLVPEN